MSAEKTIIGVLLVAGAFAFAAPGTGSEPSGPAVDAARPASAAVPASSIRSEADVQRLASPAECPGDPVSYWGPDKVAALARCMTALAPVQYADGNVLTGVRSEGRTLILEVRYPGSLSGYVADREVAATLVCNQAVPRDLIAKGVAVRLDITGADGSRVAPALVSRCS